jgi:hypothetical protein
MGETGYTECAATEEIKGAFLCQSYTQEGMNAALARTGAFVEGLDGIKPRTLVTHDNHDIQLSFRRIGGHDYVGKDLKAFFDFITNECAKATDKKNVCLSPAEEEFYHDFILPQLRINPDFVVITFAARSNMAWDDVVTHEIMHAQYFLQEKFRSAVDAFWENDVSASDKTKIQKLLNAIGYAVYVDPLLLKNEFQAYILMEGAESSHLSRWVDAMRPALLAKLKAAGAVPVQVH